jgi:hypothetical protein
MKKYAKNLKKHLNLALQGSLLQLGLIMVMNLFIVNSLHAQCGGFGNSAGYQSDTYGGEGSKTELTAPIYGPYCEGDDTVVFEGEGVYSFNGEVITGFSPEMAGSYTFFYTAVNEDGCTVTCVFDIEVIPIPLVIAGDDETICEDGSFITDPVIENVESVFWNSIGDGWFDDHTMVNATYTPGIDDLTTGYVELCIEVQGNTPCEPVSDCLTLYFQLLPVVDAGDDATLCEQPWPNGTYNLNGTLEYSCGYVWTTFGDGTFDDAFALDAVYTIGVSDNAAGSVELALYAISCDPCMVPITDYINITIEPCQQLVQIQDGWSGISSFIGPDMPEIIDVLNPINEELILVYNFNGIYWPDGGVFTLPPWDPHSGYVIKVSKNTNLPFYGNEVTDKTVDLISGWNLIPTLSSAAYDIETLFAGVEGFVLAKDVAGTGVYWKTYGINTIGAVLPGKAYYVMMNVSGMINYELPADNSIPGKPIDHIEISTPWNAVIQNPPSHLVAFDIAESPIESGDIIGGFTPEGWCVGVTGIGNPDLAFAVNLNGDDSYSSAKDGFETGDMMSYKLYRPSTGETFDFAVSYDPQWDHAGQFVVNGLSVVTDVKFEATNITNPAQQGLRIYPNPNYGTFTIEGMDTKINVRIFNAFGEEVYMHELDLPAKVDLSTQPKGIYFIRVEMDNSVFFEKLVIN